MNNELETVARSLGIYGKLDELGLDSPSDILSKLPHELQNLLRLDEAACNTLIGAAAKQAYDWRLREKVGQELIQSQGPGLLTTGDATMDELLGQGIPLETITEIVGESSCGKTQLALQLCLTVQRPIQEGGLDGAAVYIHSEGPFPSHRLDQMVNHQPSMTEAEKRKAKAQIHTVYIKDSEQQYRTIAYQLPAFLESHKNVRLIVIDSICAVYRGEGTGNRGAKFEKMTEICDMGTRLKQMAAKHRVAIVALNQVSDVPDAPAKLVESWLDFELVSHAKKGIPSPLGIYIQSLTKRPVLGLSWSNSVTTRIRLARSPMTDGLATRRALFVEFSPFAPRIGCEFTICNSGIHSVEDDGL